MLGALIGAGSSIIGGLMGQSNANKQMALQKQFAKNAIQWKAADAEKAGISKLYAMGANTTSYAPVSVGGTLGPGISEAGQNIGRAIDATASPAGRAGVLATELAQAQLEGVRADNDLKRAELLSKSVLRSQPGTGPAVLDSETLPHIPGQGNSAVKYENKIAPAGYVPQKSFGVSPEIDMYRSKHGYSPEVPQQLGESQESQPLSAAQWFIRNKLMPGIDDAYKTFPYPAPEGHYWQFNPMFGEYMLKTTPKGGAPTWENAMKKLRQPRR